MSASILLHCTIAALLLALSTLAAAQPGCPPIITRAEWGALDPVEVVTIDEQVPYQFVHHAAGPACFTPDDCMQRIRDIQVFHMTDPDHLWNDIGYSFLIGGDGNIYEGRGWNVEGAHTAGFNRVGYGTCFLGNFMETIPEAAAVNSYMQLLDCGMGEGWVQSDFQLFGHRQAKATLCPGDQLYALIQGWPNWTPGNPAKRQ